MIGAYPLSAVVGASCLAGWPEIAAGNEIEIV
jgi:hypothetical protein